jgi:hypothetical protein
MPIYRKKAFGGSGYKGSTRKKKQRSTTSTSTTKRKIQALDPVTGKGAFEDSVVKPGKKSLPQKLHAGGFTQPGLANVEAAQASPAGLIDPKTALANIQGGLGKQTFADKARLTPESRYSDTFFGQDVGGRILPEAGTVANWANLVSSAYAPTAIVRGVMGSLASKTAQVGTKGISEQAAKTTAKRFATNAATEKATGSWLSKLYAAATNPTAVVGTLMTAVGSYPFAGFIKEEALQTIGFASETAIKSGDVEGAEAAVALQEEILNPDAQSQLMQKIPVVNIMHNLGDFFEAAGLKVSVDKARIEDMKLEAGGQPVIDPKTGLQMIDPKTGEGIVTEPLNEGQAIVRRQEENRQANEAAHIKRLEREALASEMERQAWADHKAAQRREDRDAMREQAEFWKQYKQDVYLMEAEERQRIAEFWLAYLKAKLGLQAAAGAAGGGGGRSSLGFGLF